VLGLGYAGWLLWQRTKTAAANAEEAQAQRIAVNKVVKGIDIAKADLPEEVWMRFKTVLMAAVADDPKTEKIVKRAKEAT